MPLTTKTCVVGHVGYSCQNEKVNARKHIPLLVVEHLDPGGGGGGGGVLPYMGYIGMCRGIGYGF